MWTSVLHFLLACARKADTSGRYYMVQRTLLYNSHLLSVVSAVSLIMSIVRSLGVTNWVTTCSTICKPIFPSASDVGY